MPSFNAIGEISIAPTPTRVEAWIDSLSPFHPAIGRTNRGGTEVIITIEAEGLHQANRVASTLLWDALGQLDAFHIMTTEDFDEKFADPDMPELVGVTDAAEILGVTRQRVQQMAHGGQIPFVRVGNGLAMPRSVIERMAGLRAQSN